MASRFKKWKAYQEAFILANTIFKASISFPKEERYSLSSQIIRSSRSVCANLAESYGKRHYVKHFRSKLTDCIAENFETQTWLDFALEANYIDKELHQVLMSRSESCGKLLTYMFNNPGKFC